MIAAALLLLSAEPALALSPPPAPLALSEAEAALVLSGEIVVREGPPVLGLAYVAAPPQVVLEEVLNLTARVSEVGPIQALELYGQEPGRVGARWDVGLMGLGATFHVLYEYDLAAGWCSFALDTGRENDIETSPGSYQAYPYGAGSLLVYRTGADGAGQAPSWLKELLQTRSLREQLGGIRARAEAR